MRFLFVDRIFELVPAQFVRGIKHITRDDAYLCPDEHGRLCFIPSLIGESLGQLAAWNVMVSNNFTYRPVAGLASKARLVRPAYVGETLLLESYIDSLDDTAVQYHSVARVRDEIVFTIDGALGPLLPMAEFIDEEDVRRQFKEINRPGTWLDISTEGEQPLEQFPLGSLPMALMYFDRIVESNPKVMIRAEKRITRAAPYFPDHFPNKPVLPMTVLLECQLNLARDFVKRSDFKVHYVVSELRRIKMSEFIYPGDVVVCTLSVKRQDDEVLILTCRSEVSGKRICVMDLELVVQR